MKASVLVFAALCVAGAYGCAHTYTHGRGLIEAPGCHYNHVRAGLDWPEKDDACKWHCAGRSQSPIDVQRDSRKCSGRVQPAFRSSLDFGVATNLTVLNLGHAVQVEFNSPLDNRASVVVCGDSVYHAFNNGFFSHGCKRVPVEPLQFHFHSTSEHLLDGQSASLELHLVTKLVGNADTLPVECRALGAKCLAVFGVQYELKQGGRSDLAIQRIVDNLPECDEVGPACRQSMPGVLRLRDLLPRDTRYYTYTGSLTTPPCSEGVMWHVFGTVKSTISQEQLLELQLALSTAKKDFVEEKNRLNNRAVQALNGRKVFVA